MTLLLASTSSYRRRLVEKLGIQIEQTQPRVDEETLKTELLKQKLTPAEVAQELSRQKGLSVFNTIQDKTETVVLSGDQLVSFNSQILGKPHTAEKALAQLQQMRGQWHELITCAHLFTAQQTFSHTAIVRLKMRPLSDDELRAYVAQDQPLDCAGSYKIEERGTALFEKIETDDFTTIQGLPMIWLATLLKELNYEFFKY